MHIAALPSETGGVFSGTMKPASTEVAIPLGAEAAPPGMAGAAPEADPAALKVERPAVEAVCAGKEG